MKIIGAICIALWCTAGLCNAGPINPLQGDLQEEPLDLAGEPLAVEREQRQVETGDITRTFDSIGVTFSGTFGSSSFSFDWMGTNVVGTLPNPASSFKYDFRGPAGFTATSDGTTYKFSFMGSMAQVVTPAAISPATLTSTSAAWQLGNMALTFTSTDVGDQVTSENLSSFITQVFTPQSALQVIFSRVPNTDSIPCVDAAGAGGLGALLDGFPKLPGGK